jgi:drug/metabolite transporter (DMT)-like permease
MLWFGLSLAAALCQSANDAITKGFFGDLTAYEMGAIRLTYALPFLLFGLLIIPVPPLDLTFWICLAVGLPLELSAFLCYMRAIKVSPLSLTLPFLAFTPAFVILSGYLVLGETPSTCGITGIAMIVVGSYLLHLNQVRRNWLAPVQAVFMEQGSWLMLLVAMIYSLTATIGKLAILHSSPTFFGVAYFLLFTLLVFSLFPLIPRAHVRNLFAKPFPGVASGLALAGMIFSHTFAISLIQAAYMLSIKRSSLLFGVIFGAVFFRERNLRERLLGASVMMSGVLTIGFLG